MASLDVNKFVIRKKKKQKKNFFFLPSKLQGVVSWGKKKNK